MLAVIKTTADHSNRKEQVSYSMLDLYKTSEDLYTTPTLIKKSDDQVILKKH